MIRGSVQVIDLRADHGLAAAGGWTAQVRHNNHAAASGRAKPAALERDQARDLRDQGEPHLRPGLRRSPEGQRRPVADLFGDDVGAQPPRARAPLHAARQLLRRRRGVRRRPPLVDAGAPPPTTSTRPGRSTTPGPTTELRQRVRAAGPAVRRASRWPRDPTCRARRRPRPPATCGTTPTTTASASATTARARRGTTRQLHQRHRTPPT